MDDEFDLSQVNNPYDFAYPVLDEKLFAGRKREIEDITYYLDQAKATLRPMSIAILGPRASGKTSLLNMAELEAKKRKFCTARVNLDENDSVSLLIFFFKVFDAAFHAALEHGAFDGLGGNTHDSYLDMVSSYTIPEVKTYSPFTFPVQFAKAMNSGNSGAIVSDNSLQRDLRLIAEEVKSPIVLIFDEMNVLSGSRVHLQKLRNIFMNLPGFMLVLAGTPELFPAMDDVFSPIARQFKKIIIGGFEDRNDTEACVKRPLEKLGLDPERIIAPETFADFEELHTVSGGNPYEIQLICHFMFRRVQEKRAKKMKLDAAIFEDVVRELESSQKLARREMLRKIKSLTDRQFNAMKYLCSGNGAYPFKYIWDIEYILHGQQLWTEAALREVLGQLVERKFLAVDSDDKITFQGDEFDKIYCKYYARERNIALSFSEFPIQVYWYFQLMEYLTFEQGRTVNSFGADDEPTFLPVIEALRDNTADHDFINEHVSELSLVYSVMIENRNFSVLRFITFRINCEWLKMSTWFYETDSEAHLQVLDDITKRANEIGLTTENAYYDIPVMSREKLQLFVSLVEDLELRNEIVSTHLESALNDYWLEAPKEEIIYHLTALQDAGVADSPNDRGYLFLFVNELAKAEEMLQTAIAEGSTPFWRSLSTYNLGIVKIQRGQFDQAEELLVKCVTDLQSISPDSRECSALFIVEILGGSLIVTERRQPQDLFFTASASVQALKSYLSAPTDLSPGK